MFEKKNAWRETYVPRHDRVFGIFGAGQRLCRGLNPYRCLERSAARIALPHVAHTASIDTFRPFGNVDALAALRALDHWP